MIVLMIYLCATADLNQCGWVQFSEFRSMEDCEKVRDLIMQPSKIATPVAGMCIDLKLNDPDVSS